MKSIDKFKDKNGEIGAKGIKKREADIKKRASGQKQSVPLGQLAGEVKKILDISNTNII